jgi:hypothetical protein
MMVARLAPITLPDIADWLPPHEALRIVGEALGDEYFAKDAIRERLLGGKITAAAESRAWEDYPEGSTGPALIPDVIWSRVSTGPMAHLWMAGDMAVSIGYYDGHFNVVIRYYGVKFDPDGIRALVANAPKPPSTQSPARVKPELSDMGAHGGGMAERAKPVQRQVSAEEFASWWSPLQATRYAVTCVGSLGTARNALWSRLYSGLIEAAATATTAQIGTQTPKSSRQPELIPPTFWRAKSGQPGAEFWNGSDIDFFIRDTLFEYFGVKLNPNDVRSTFLRAPAELGAPKEDETPKFPPELPAEPPQKGPPVADEHLRAWYDLYQKVYSGTAADTEGNAHASAQGMFPGKSVSRERIRALRGAQKRGRKPTDSAK